MLAQLGANPNGNHWNRPGTNVCVHGFIGKLADGSVAAVQTLPWDWRGWHAGTGYSGKSANDTHISFEICEDGLTDPVYFAQIYQVAVELTAMLCKEYSLDPLADGVVICHNEGYGMGIASNHGDVYNWFPKHGKMMDNFRADVARTMKGDDDMLTYEQWKEYMDRYRKELRADHNQCWAEGELAAAVAAGITNGTRPPRLCYPRGGGHYGAAGGAEQRVSKIPGAWDFGRKKGRGSLPGPFLFVPLHHLRPHPCAKAMCNPCVKSC